MAELKTKWGSNSGADVKFKKRQRKAEEKNSGKKAKKNSGKKEG